MGDTNSKICAHFWPRPKGTQIWPRAPISKRISRNSGRWQGLARCPVGGLRRGRCGALVVSCSRRVGSVYFQRVLGASPRSVLIHQDQRQEAKVKSEGKKNIILERVSECVRALAGWLAGWRKKERQARGGGGELLEGKKRCRDYHRTRTRRTVECVWSMSSLLGAYGTRTD